MPIDFHAEKNRYTYATREADPSWRHTITVIVDPRGKRVVDVGCGGGTYSQAWAQLGAAEVIGIDFSEQMVQAAAERLRDGANISFHIGSALSTGLRRGCADIVFERALVHHIADLSACLYEAYRVLGPNGVYIIQDRTPDDVQMVGSREHMRGYFFERFPHLLAGEACRRPRQEALENRLRRVGFATTETLTFWETRQVYPNFAALAEDLKERTGRSILHELNDTEVAESFSSCKSDRFYLRASAAR